MNFSVSIYRFENQLKVERAEGRQNLRIFKSFILSFVTSLYQLPLVHKQSATPVVYYGKRHQFDLELFILLACYFSMILSRPDGET